jgi:hypothetical protein
MASLTTGLVLAIIIQDFIIKHTSVNKRDEIHKFVIVNNHECPTDHEYVVVRVITNQSRLRGLCPRNGPKVTLTYLSMFLITLSNDVDINPGPLTFDSLYPCGTCDKPVTWDDGGIVCDTCNQWYHANCQSMKSSLYLEHVNDSAVAWGCLACNCPNYTSVCFSVVFSTTNQFSVLSDTSISSPVSSNQIKPVHTSTPTRALSTPKGVKQQPLRISSDSWRLQPSKMGLERKHSNLTLNIHQFTTDLQKY